MKMESKNFKLSDVVFAFLGWGLALLFAYLYFTTVLTVDKNIFLDRAEWKCEKSIIVDDDLTRVECIAWVRRDQL